MTRLPEEIRTMKALRVLSVMNNNIETVSFAVGYLENLRILKLAGNPLDKGLKGILDGNDGSPSLLVASLGNKNNEKEALLTIRVKQYLKAEAAALESGGESRYFLVLANSISQLTPWCSESPVDTPRPLKRNNSLRFPVVPITSGSESAPDLKSPNFYKPQVPIKSHYRILSGQNSVFQNATSRRPGIAPLIIGNERNRSNSESVLQASQTTRIKRMGIVTRKNSESEGIGEIRSARNSYHHRGLSYGSVLRDRNTNGARSAGGGSSSNPSSPLEIERYRGTFVRRLSSLPEAKRESYPVNKTIEGVRGVLYALHQYHSNVGPLISVIKEPASKRSGLEKIYHSASTSLEGLDQELHIYDMKRSSDHDEKEYSIEKVSNYCRTCIGAFQQLNNLLLRNVPQLAANADPRYVRTLLLMLYGSMVEVRNACLLLRESPEHVSSTREQKPSIPSIVEEQPKSTIRPMTPTKERPIAMRRLHSETAMNSVVTHQYGHAKSTTNPHSTVPLYINGRSRSNSRTNTFEHSLSSSLSSSIANTPRSGESFLIPGTPVSSESTAEALSFHDHDLDSSFEKIYLDFKKSIERALIAIPHVSMQFSRCLELARGRKADNDIIDLWSRLITRCRFCLDMCEALKARLSTVKLNDPEIRNSRDFWRLCTGYANSFTKLIDAVWEAKRLQLIHQDIQRILQPVYKYVKNAVLRFTNSPWSTIMEQSTPPQQHGVVQWHNNNGIGRVNGYGSANGHHRTRGGSGSSSSPYPTSVPATPLSAALGPAAQATIPSTPASAVGFERRGYGDGLQRAEPFLGLQGGTMHRR